MSVEGDFLKKAVFLCIMLMVTSSVTMGFTSNTNNLEYPDYFKSIKEDIEVNNITIYEDENGNYFFDPQHQHMITEDNLFTFSDIPPKWVDYENIITLDDNILDIDEQDYVIQSTPMIDQYLEVIHYQNTTVGSVMIHYYTKRPFDLGSGYSSQSLVLGYSSHSGNITEMSQISVEEGRWVKSLSEYPNVIGRKFIKATYQMYGYGETKTYGHVFNFPSGYQYYEHVVNQQDILGDKVLYYHPGLAVSILPGKVFKVLGIVILGWQFIEDFSYSCDLSAWPQLKLGQYYNNCTWYSLEGGVGYKHTTIRLWDSIHQYESGHPPIATKTIKVAIP
jgi:hypothetical protein